MKAFILAGGSGSRLWPLSRVNYPKQFLTLHGEVSLLKKTVSRVQNLVALEDIFILTSDQYFHDIRFHLPELPQGNIIVEPSRKNTAPALALAMRYVIDCKGAESSEVALVLPADHVIEPEAVFLEALKRGSLLAESGKIVTFGVTPTRPETGFGYIKRGQAIDEHHFQVDQFVEKPELTVAEGYLQSGHYFWNGGLFAFTLKTLQEALQEHCPELNHSSYEGLAEQFHTLTSESIDYGIMEKSNNVVVLPLNLSWSDLGSWENVYDLATKDLQANVTVGNVLAEGCQGSLFFAGKRLVAAIDVDDLLVVETDDALLLCRRGSSQKVKTVVETLLARGHKEAIEHKTTERPWGRFTVLEQGERYKIKKIAVYPGERLSLQRHNHRSEHWVVVKGTAQVTVDESTHLVHENESIFVPKNAVHRVENPGKILLEIIEVQVGEYLGEDDIIRLEDRYGRV